MRTRAPIPCSACRGCPDFEVSAGPTTDCDPPPVQRPFGHRGRHQGHPRPPHRPTDRQQSFDHLGWSHAKPWSPHDVSPDKPVRSLHCFHIGKLEQYVVTRNIGREALSQQACQLAPVEDLPRQRQKASKPSSTWSPSVPIEGTNQHMPPETSPYHVS